MQLLETLQEQEDRPNSYLLFNLVEGLYVTHLHILQPIHVQ